MATPQHVHRFFRLCCIAVLLAASLTTRAQWVPVHQGFANYISTYISAAAVNGNQLDTTHTAITTLQNLTINPSTVTDITGIQYFDGLQNLVVNSYQLSATPLMPPGLQSLQLANAGTAIAGPLPSGLKALKINGGNFTTMPAFPASLTKLIIYNIINATPVIPALPPALQHLEIRNMPGSFTVFPTIPASVSYVDFSNTEFGPAATFHAGLDTFMCKDCEQLTTIPNLPPTMKNLEVPRCAITSFGTTPDTMNRLDLSANLLTSITIPQVYTEYLWLNDMPSLTSVGTISTLTIRRSFYVYNSPNVGAQALLGKLRSFNTQGIDVSAHHCNINSLPQFKAYISTLDVSYNPITALPTQSQLDPQCSGSNCDYPMDNLHSLSVSHCELTHINQHFFTNGNGWSIWGTSLDASYNFLTHIYWTPSGSYNSLNLSHNQITDYDQVLYAQHIDLSYNQITCLPYIYPGVENLNVTNNPLNCLPNIPDTAFHCTPNYGVCQPGNSNNCPVFSIAGGQMFNDTSNDGYRQAGEGLLPYYSALLSPDGAIHQSNHNGSYSFNCDVNINYTIGGLSTYPYRHITTPPYTVQYSTYGQIDTMHPIGVYVHPDVNDLMVWITPLGGIRPGFYTRYRITVKNEGTTVQNGTAVFNYDPAIVYQSSLPAAGVQGTSLTWVLPTLNPLEIFEADADFLVPAIIPLGDTLYAGAHALGNTPDTTATNNHDTIFEIAVGSYDPNDKQVFPATGLTMQQIQNGAYLEYLVRFQNTGTASAINVRVEDTLSPLLQLGSFEMMYASHNYRLVIENRILKVYFDNINLPDSGANEMLSHGFFRYRIKPSDNLNTGDVIPNTALIYFDFNAPVVTNTTVTTITTLFAQHPVGQQLCTGEHLRLVAKTNIAGASRQWYVNGLATGITTDTLYIDSVTTTHQGAYTYGVTIDAETFYSNVANVHVYGANVPAISFTVAGNNIAGDTMWLCSTSTGPTYTYDYNVANVQPALPGTMFKWYINDTLVAAGTSYEVRLQRYWRTGDRLACYTESGCSSTASGDSVIAIVTSKKDTVHIDITPYNPVICPGQSVTFTATAPLASSIGWLLNGQGLGGNGSFTRTFNNLVNGDRVSARMYPVSAACPQVTYVNGRNLLYDTVTVTVSNAAQQPAGTALISLASPPFCPGISNRLNVTGTQWGTTPHYQWLVNGQPFGTDTNNISSNTFNTGDVVQVKIARQLCLADTILSNAVTLHSDSTPPQTVQIAYTVFTTACQAGLTFRPTLQNTGTGNHYKWYKNGTMVSTSGSFYNLNRTPGVTDTIQLEVNTHRPCADSMLYSNIVILPPYYKMNHGGIYFTAPTANYACPGANVVFSTTAPSHNWYRNGVFIVNNNFSFSTSSTTDFTVMDVWAGDACYLPDTAGPITIQVVPNITPQVSVVYEPAALCAGQPAIIKLASNVAGISGQWYINNMYADYGAQTTAINLQEGDVVRIEAGIYGNCYTYTGPFADSVTIHYITQTPQVDVIPQHQALCDGNTANSFTADGYYLGSSPVYQWMKNGTPVGSNSYMYADNNLAANDYIYCNVTSNNPCVTNALAISDTFNTVALASVTPTAAISGQANVCAGTPYSVAGSFTNAGTTPVYQWLVNGVAQSNTGSGFSSSNLANGDSVVCVLHSSFACVTNAEVTSNVLVADILPLPVTPQVSPMQVSVCYGDSAQLQATSPENVYQWSTGEVTPLMYATTGGNYTVRVQGANGCWSNASVPAQVTVYPLPAVPVITVNGNTLSSSTSQNTWLLNGQVISGANQTTYTVTQTGWYSLQTTNVNGCSAIAAPVYVVLSGITTTNAGTIAVYPNPASQQVNVVYSLPENEDADLKLYDITGRLILTQHLAYGQGNVSISLRNLLPGTYNYKAIGTKGRLHSGRLIIIQ